ncbi:MAG: hypothetical protein CMD18_01440 [Flavobacteriales bacterium]|nr:hypothetical protein [Flavobacteriales bacterium]
MNNMKSIIYSALSLGFAFVANAQGPEYSLNGLGRSIITNNALSGNALEGADNTQKGNVSGYNLFDLQTNLDLDSTFNAKAILRTRSPYGTAFGAQTAFEFRMFSMGGKLNGLKYEFGDIRLELTPYTIFNSDIAASGYESKIFSERREILEYENFNEGNTWLLQGVSAQYAWNIGREGGLGFYGFTTRTSSSNEFDVPDRLLSGGRLEYQVNKKIKFGINEAALYDLAVATSEFDYTNFVTTADLNFENKTEKSTISFNTEVGGSMFSYTRNIDDFTQEYSDMVVSANLGYDLTKTGIGFGLNFRNVGATFFSPTAQTRRYNTNSNPMLFGNIESQLRSQIYYDQFTDEDVYNASILTTLDGFLQAYNNLSPFGDATPNRMVVGLEILTDTSITGFEASLNADYGQEITGEGGDDLRTFMVLTGGGILKIGELLGTNRIIDISSGVRFENTSRTQGAKVDLTSLLLDVGLSVEVVKKVDLLGGIKHFNASGNEYLAIRDGFNLVTDFQEFELNANETIFSGGARVRFSKQQAFSLNYNLAQFVDNNKDNSQLNIGQVFINYTGKF